MQPLFLLLITVVCFTCCALGSPGYVSALYYSEWSFPGHVPAQIPLSHVTNIYFAFFEIDKGSKNIKFMNSSLDVSEMFKLNTTTIREDCSDIKHLFIGSNIDHKYYSSLPWINDYLNAADDLLDSDDIAESEGIIGQLHQLRTLNPRLKISMSVGGANSGKSFRSVASTKKSIKQFVANLAANVDALGFDGVDIDWEFPSSKHDAKLLTYMLALLSSKFATSDKNKRKIVSLAIPLDLSTLRHYNFRALDQYIDYYNLMGYDISGTWSSVVGYHSQLYTDKNIPESSMSVDSTIKYLDPLVNRSKILLGMPAYGISFNTNELYQKFTDCAPIGEVYATGDVDKDDKCNIDYNRLPPDGYIEVSNTNIGAAYAHSGPNQQKGIVVYDTPEISRLKARYVVTNGLGGGMWWDSKGDTLIADTNRSLVYNFVDELGGIHELTSQIIPFEYNGTLESGITSTKVGSDDQTSISDRLSVRKKHIYFILVLFYICMNA